MSSGDSTHSPGAAQLGNRGTSDTRPLDQVEGFEKDRLRLPVGDANGGDGVGFVERDVLIPGLTDLAPDIAPIYRDETGDEVIAMWGYSYGWITLEAYHRADFDLEKLVADKQRRAAEGIVQE